MKCETSENRDFLFTMRGRHFPDYCFTENVFIKSYIIYLYISIYSAIYTYINVKTLVHTHIRFYYYTILSYRLY